MQIPKDKRFQDLTGLRFKKLTVIEYAGKTDKSKHMWLCKCDCGSDRIISGGNLKKGMTTSCGCAQKEIVHKNQFKDLTGLKFSRLTVIIYAGKSKPENKKMSWSSMVMYV